MRTFAIIPAAGRSTRMGQPKLLLPWGNSTVIEHVLAAWRGSRVDHVIVVLHRNDKKLADLCAACGAIALTPQQPPPEMIDSIRHGLEVVAQRFQPHDDDAWLVAPADMPTLNAEIINRLIEAHDAGILRPGVTPPIRAPRHGPKHAHPVLFPWPLAAEVASLGAGQALNALVARHGVETIDSPGDAVADDFDTPEEYQRLRDRLGM